MTATTADGDRPSGTVDPADDEASIVATAQDWARAIVANDSERIGAFLTADWAIVSETGISPRAEFLAVVASGDLTHSAMQTVGEPDVRILRDAAVLTARVTNTAHYRRQRFDADEWTTDVWVRRHGRWLCARSHITPARDPG